MSAYTPWAWERLCETYQPMRTVYPDGGGKPERVAHGDPKPRSHAFGAQKSLVLLSVAHLLDRGELASYDALERVTGLSRGVLSRECNSLVAGRWLNTSQHHRIRAFWISK